MTEISNEYIEDAFTKIRAEFEERTNITGLEILDSYEEKWTAYGSLTDRQIGWLEKQLDGSWQQKTELATKLIDDGSAPIEQEAGIIQFQALDRDFERRVEAMISRKLAEPGTTVVDLKQLDDLEEAIDGLKRAVIAMR